MYKKLALLGILIAWSGGSFGQQAGISNDALFAEVYRNVEKRAFPKVPAIWFGKDPIPKKIPVCWEDDYAESDRGLVRDAVHSTWEINSKVEFTNWGKCVPKNKGIRIVVEDVGPKKGPHTKGLGNEIDGMPNGMSLDFAFKNFGSSCINVPDTEKKQTRELCIRAIAIHEFGHALGFAHEQNRDDTPNWCKTKKLEQGENGTDETVTPWDPKSVMNYCFNIYTYDVQLSQFDLAVLRKYYGSP